MAFIVRTQKQRMNKPDGFYFRKDGLDLLLTEVTVSASGRLCLKLHDPIRMTHEVVQVADLETIAKMVDGLEFIGEC